MRIIRRSFLFSFLPPAGGAIRGFFKIDRLTAWADNFVRFHLGFIQELPNLCEVDKLIFGAPFCAEPKES